MNTQRLPLIYILGSGHSGSTLLDLLLGSHSKIESVGELFQLPNYISPESTYERDMQICTCGQHISDCPYWQSVLATVQNQSVYQINDKNTANFNTNNYDLIKAILSVSRKNVVLDSSKKFGRLLRLIESDLFKVTVIHLVRDGRAVAFSMDRKGKKRRKESDSDYKSEPKMVESENKKYSFYQELKTWNSHNLSSHQQFKGDSRIKYLVIKYEDLARNPQKTLTKILNLLELSFENSQLDFSSVTHHNISGNRMRRIKSSEITLDKSYQHHLSWSDWWKATIIANRGLRTFGYSLRK